VNEVGDDGPSAQEEQAAPDDRQVDEEEQAWLGVLSDEPLRFAVVGHTRPPFSMARPAAHQPRGRKYIDEYTYGAPGGRKYIDEYTYGAPGADQPVPAKLTKKWPAGEKERVTSSRTGRRTSAYGGYFATLEDADDDDDDQKDGMNNDIFVVTEAAESCYTKVSAIVDSGAVEHVLPPTYLPRVKMVESPGSKTGKRYLSATGEAIMNLGQKSLYSKTREGQARNITFQIAPVRKPLISVAKMCEAGNDVILTERPHIRNRQTGQVTALRREGKTFVLDLWVRRPTSAAAAVAAAAGTQAATAAATAARAQAAAAERRVFSRRV
jgi:hypothetical protein